MLINERPTFYQGHKVYTPNSLDSAVLCRSSTLIKVFTISDFIIPKDKEFCKSIVELTAESKRNPNLIASETATHLLNKIIFADSLAIGELVYVIDLLIAKNLTPLLTP